MMNWIAQFLFNLKIPISMVAMLIVGACGVVARDAFLVNRSTKFGAVEHTDAQNRILMCAQLSIVVAFIAALFWAVPSPDFKIIMETKTVVKTVKVLPSYMTYYNNCVATAINGKNVEITGDGMQQCHTIAMAALTPSTKIVVKHYRYPDLFKNCMGAWTIDDGDNKLPNMSPAMIHNQRIEICHRAAMEASQ